MEFRRHDAGDDSGIRIHELPRGAFVSRFENYNAERFVAGFGSASGQNYLARFRRFFETIEMPFDCSLVALGPSLVVVQARYEMQT